jgi:hypothetical protein
MEPVTEVVSHAAHRTSAISRQLLANVRGDRLFVAFTEVLIVLPRRIADGNAHRAIEAGRA